MIGACRHRGRLLLKLAMAWEKIGEDPCPYRLGMVYPSAQRASQKYLALEPQMRGRWKLSAWLIWRASERNQISERGIANVNIFTTSSSCQGMRVRVLSWQSPPHSQRHSIVWSGCRAGYVARKRRDKHRGTYPCPLMQATFKGLFAADA